MTETLQYEQSVKTRYEAAAKQREATLCCPVEYPTELLEAIPDEILQRDYGCGDPSPFLRSGDTVLDLGSGGGKLCYIAAQVVGAQGRVIGVDCNTEMLQLARKYQAEVAKSIGFDNVSFRCGLIQDLQLDLQLLSSELSRNPKSGVDGILEQRQIEQRLRREQPLLPNNSVDCIVSNCVLNLVRPQDRQELFREMFRVLKPGGRVAISDIVSDEDVPEHLKSNSTLWSGCISGAWREDEFIAEFARAGFHGMFFAKREQEPWKTVEGIEFRSVTVVGYKGKQGPCLERNQALMYRGPFNKIEDDDGHVFFRGQRAAVCDKTFRLLQEQPYADLFIPIEPYEEVSLAQAEPFQCQRNASRHPRESKGIDYSVTSTEISNCDGNEGECC
ncbi:methyltransferase domain-containing protein [Adhaeretor mobilis]|uniref:Arsenite methyltransferase n=1 Tax=Adhaeretor mobilis TaxID=1930276 RepID=A0A517N0T6_9BACT|nr:methyltransferase domain-containing protein [Adhaeretor mobilis]QDT00751.1 arsenite S-adenosylmethyltransferase [Adhaeretor mobilis]